MPPTAPAPKDKSDALRRAKGTTSGCAAAWWHRRQPLFVWVALGRSARAQVATPPSRPDQHFALGSLDAWLASAWGGAAAVRRGCPTDVATSVATGRGARKEVAAHNAKSPATQGLSMRRRGLELHPVIPDQALNLVTRVSYPSGSRQIVRTVPKRGRYGRIGRTGCCHGCCHAPAPLGVLGVGESRTNYLTRSQPPWARQVGRPLPPPQSRSRPFRASVSDRRARRPSPCRRSRPSRSGR